jgi:hypothetical protein
MKISLVTPNQLDKAEITNLSQIAQAGFERLGDPSMHEDTLRHIGGADMLQIIESAGKPVAFSMYQRCLWR